MTLAVTYKTTQTENMVEVRLY